MLDLYAFSTPNSVRIPIALEEMGLDYRLHAVNLRKGAQKSPEHLARNPNGKVPVLIDNEGPDGAPFTLTESGAILLYLAEKTGKLIPTDAFDRARVIEQMLFHLTGISPALGQLGNFRRAEDRLPAAISLFEAETARTLTLLDGILGQRRFVAGEDYTVADITHFGWLWRREFAMVSLDPYANIRRWYAAVEARSAVQRGTGAVTALLPA
ncbi:glutathione S-transferase family protein [Acidimangrovimonas sediminis]|uniref:glutathione S-transferase family protein n=1 Tax=Acidimangrovimonas sediminis TaxID=2056283 RepID=UPI000C8074C0|nr:glutathione S-transferase family protein [Acidimangrovimonas sediminis]